MGFPIPRLGFLHLLVWKRIYRKRPLGPRFPSICAFPRVSTRVCQPRAPNSSPMRTSLPQGAFGVSLPWSQLPSCLVDIPTWYQSAVRRVEIIDAQCLSRRSCSSTINDSPSWQVVRKAAGNRLPTGDPLMTHPTNLPCFSRSASIFSSSRAPEITTSGSGT